MFKQPLSTRQFLLLAVGLAVLLRLVLMPFFAHVDLFSEYRRVHYAIDQELWFAHTHRIVTFYIEMIFVGLSKLFIPTNELTFYLPDPAKSTASLQDYYLFLQDPYIFRYLFFYKLPYFLFDLATAAVIWRFIDNARARRIALLLWLFNPLTLYATYIFGRFEVIAIFFLALATLQLKHHNILLAALCFATALMSREIYLLFAPFLLVACIDHKDPWLKNFLVVSVVTAIILGALLGPDYVARSMAITDPFIDPDADHNFINKLFSMAHYWFYPIVAGLFATFIYVVEIRTRAHDERFILGGALALCVYFAFNVHSVHYASWLIILPLLAMQFDREVVFPLLALFAVWILLWFLKTDAGVFTPFLAAPLSSDFIGIGHFPTWFQANVATEDLPLHRAIQLVRTLFATVMFYLVYRLVVPARG